MGKVLIPKDTSSKEDFMIRLGDKAFSLRGLAETIEEIRDILSTLRSNENKKR